MYRRILVGYIYLRIFFLLEGLQSVPRWALPSPSMGLGAGSNLGGRMSDSPPTAMPFHPLGVRCRILLYSSQQEGLPASVIFFHPTFNPKANLSSKSAFREGKGEALPHDMLLVGSPGLKHQAARLSNRIPPGASVGPGPFHSGTHSQGAFQ